MFYIWNSLRIVANESRHIFIGVYLIFKPQEKLFLECIFGRYLILLYE